MAVKVIIITTLHPERRSLPFDDIGTSPHVCHLIFDVIIQIKTDFLLAQILLVASVLQQASDSSRGLLDEHRDWCTGDSRGV